MPQPVKRIPEGVEFPIGGAQKKRFARGPGRHDRGGPQIVWSRETLVWFGVVRGDAG